MTGPKILVAIDIVEDQVVRLTRGEFHERTVYGHDPVETALDWEEKGAEWLHVIDLDGAAKGEQENSQAIETILSRTGVPVQVGGGIRSLDAIDGWLKKGAERVVIGTKALEQAFLEKAVVEFGQGIVAAVDARAGVVQVAGWTRPSEEGTLEILKRVEDAGVSRVMFTDIERDGTLTGPNVEAIEEVLDALSVPVIASGGVATEHDIRRLAKLFSKGLEGIIIGKALYSGALRLADAQASATVA